MLVTLSRKYVGETHTNRTRPVLRVPSIKYLSIGFYSMENEIIFAEREFYFQKTLNILTYI